MITILCFHQLGFVVERHHEMPGMNCFAALFCYSKYSNTQYFHQLGFVVERRHEMPAMNWYGPLFLY